MVGIKKSKNVGAYRIRPFLCLQVLKITCSLVVLLSYCPQKKGYRLTGLARLAVLFFFKSLY